jgi:hypothetical protein
MLRIELYPQLEEKIFIIDGANVCWHKTDKRNKPKLGNLKLIVNNLKTLGVREENIIIFCDLSLRYDIDNRSGYYSWLKKKFIQECPSGIKADKFILNFCLAHPNSLIISNDIFKEYRNQVPNAFWISERRIAFMKINDEFILVPIYDSKLNFRGE